jgi:hypothetical protein
MTEPHEPFPQDHDNFDIELKKALLAEALSEFSAKVLGNDMLFSAISTTLREDETAVDDEPDPRTGFSVVPNVMDGTYRLCLEQSANMYAGQVEADDGSVGETFFSFTTMKYVPICEVKQGGDGKLTVRVDKPFVELALGRDPAVDKPSKEEGALIEAAIRTVLQGVTDIDSYCSQRGVEVVIDEFGRPQLLEEAENTFRIP